MSEDPKEQIRQWMAGLPPEQLRQMVGSLMTGGLPGLGAGSPGMPGGPEPIELSDPPVEPALLTVRVDVDEVKPPVWRRLQLHGDLLLPEVHEVIQAAFGWHDSHLHKFWPGPQKRVWRGPSFVTEFELSEGEEGTLENDVRLDQLLRETGDRLFYTYDFGDDWTHTIKLEAVDPLDDAAPPARCLVARRAGPLEDVGGPWGHNELVEAYAQDPSLAGLEEHVRDWVPQGYDPTEADVEAINRQLSLIGASREEVFAALAADGGPPWPAAIEPLQDLATPPVIQQIGELCAAALERDDALTAEDVAAIVRPYRLLLELAGDDGIELTAAGWMKPAVVHQIYVELDLRRRWIGTGTREDNTAPVADLRARCQRLGLLRKHKGRLLVTRAARALGSDVDYWQWIVSRLLIERDPWSQAASGLFALLTAARGHASYRHADGVAELLTACGLRTGPMGVEHGHALEMCRDVWNALSDAADHDGVRAELELSPHAHRVVAMARAALWPDGIEVPTTS